MFVRITVSDSCSEHGVVLDSIVDILNNHPPGDRKARVSLVFLVPSDVFAKFGKGSQKLLASEGEDTAHDHKFPAEHKAVRDRLDQYVMTVDDGDY